jgi:hypothetical protein
VDVTKNVRRARVGYYNASLDRAVGYVWPEGYETATNSLPLKLEALVDVDGAPVWATLIVDSFGEDDDVRLGVRSVKVQSADEGQPLSADLYRRLRLNQLLLLAAREWSSNSDGSAVTVEQARALTRPGGRRSRTPEQRWKEAAEAYLAAQERHEPTTVAVAQALHLGTSKRGQDAARSLIRRARQAGYLPPVRKGN